MAGNSKISSVAGCGFVRGCGRCDFFIFSFIFGASLRFACLRFYSLTFVFLFVRIARVLYKG